MRILVTGSAGFIGSQVVQALQQAGHEVVGIDAWLPAVHAGREAPRDSSPVITADVRDATALRAHLNGVDAVCHQAAMVGLGVEVADLPLYASHNDFGTAVLLAEMATAGIAKLVLAGSMVVYGEGAYECGQHGRVSPGPRSAGDLDAGVFDPPCPVCGNPLVPTLVDETSPADPRNAYAASKLAQEHYVRAWARETGATAVSLRYHNVYGPGMPRNTPYAGVASIFRSAIARGERPQVYEDGRQRRDFIHVTDVAQANVIALQGLDSLASAACHVYNVGSGTPHTVGEMAEAMCAGLSETLRPEVNGRYRIGDVRHITADSSRVRAELGWRPQVSFEEGMRRLAAEPAD